MQNIPHGWVKQNESLVFTLKCRDFRHALILVNAIGDIAEKEQHHPDIQIQNYNELTVITSTHDAKELTDKDYKLAQEITDLLKNEG